MLYVCGDLNSQIGQMEDLISDTDMDVPAKVSLDNVVNRQGEMLVEFLQMLCLEWMDILER